MRARLGPRGLIVAGLLLAVVVAVLASRYASGAPDGLNRVAADHGIDQQEKAHDLDQSPLAGYEAAGVDSGMSGGVAGLVGIAATFVIGAGVVLVVRRRGSSDRTEQTATDEPT